MSDATMIIVQKVSKKKIPASVWNVFDEMEE